MDGVVVLVSGAGPVGLVAAAEMARHGVRPWIIDMAPERDGLSKALGIQVRSLELLERMGCVDAFLDAGEWSPRVTFHADRHRLGTVEMRGAGSRFEAALILAQCETERLLEEHLGTFGIDVERGTELVAFDAGDTGVDCRLRHADGTTEDLRAGWLVAADGARSAVRRTLDLPFDGVTEPGTFLSGRRRHGLAASGGRDRDLLAPRGCHGVLPGASGRRADRRVGRRGA